MAFFPALDTASIRTGHFSYSLAPPASVPQSSLHSPPSKNHLVAPIATITLHLGHGTCIRPICTYKLACFQSENGYAGWKKRRPEARGLRLIFSFASGLTREEPKPLCAVGGGDPG